MSSRHPAFHGSLAGQSWSAWNPRTKPQDSTPRPLSPLANDVMKLPKQDMHIFGECPTHDEFTLVVCDRCGRSIKIEAFDSHFELRHSSPRKDRGMKQRERKGVEDFLLKEEPPEDVVMLDDDDEDEVEPMEVEPISSTTVPSPPAAPPAAPPEEADSTTSNNVISIPENVPLPENMPNDLMAIVEGFNNDRVDSTTADIITPALQPPPPAEQQTKTTPQPTTPVKKKGDKKNRDREYDPDKHCGVWDNDAKRHCTRALTCKSHSVLIKRKIIGRTKPFDELVAEHKAVKEAMAAAAAAVKEEPVAQPQQTVFVNGLRKWEPETTSFKLTASPVVSTKTIVVTKEADENLHYTTDHPKPLAVCTFGGRRMGGLLVTDRSQLLTRKVVRVAITTGGFHRIRPKGELGVKYSPNMKRTLPVRTTQAGSFVVNYALAAPKRGIVTTPRNVKLASLPPGGIHVLPESISTDFQDLKGGYRFGLGGKIKHILPSGGEVSKWGGA